MELLPETIRSRLPSLFSQEAVDEPIVYARYFLPGTILAWFVLEGKQLDDDYLFFGFVAGLTDEFRLFRLSELKSRGHEGQTVERDMTFVEGKLTDVVPAPDH